MSNSHDNHDWSNDSASLFAEARRAHDPTLAESTRLAAVLTRIQASKADASPAANGGADIIARGATSEMLRLVARVSLAVVCIAAVSFAFMRVSRHPSEPARSAKPAPTAVGSAPPPIAAQPAIEAQPRSAGVAPLGVPSGELSASALASSGGIGPALRGGATSARDEAQSRPRSQRRRSRGTAETQQTSRIAMASVPEASSSAPSDNSTSVTPPDGVTRHERPEPRSTLKAAAVNEEAAPRATSFELSQKGPVTAAARKADPTPEDARTELAMMKRIQGALRDADFSTVLALCAEHARHWPHGVFELEREGVRAIASCGGNSDDAALRAKRFLTAHPHASVAMRVSAACAAQLMKR